MRPCRAQASLLSETDFKPPINPPKVIDDPSDKKPADWIDDPKMDEPGAAKPADWDEDAPAQIPDPKASKPESWLDDAPDMIADPTATMPSDWDEDEDGGWEAPLIKNPDCEKFGCGEWKAPVVANPDYKGKWVAPRVDNPNYKGVWAPAKIDNPHYFEDASPHAMAPIGGVGIELWTMQDGILFDNILIAHDPAVASALAEKTFVPRKALEDEAAKAAARSASLDDNGDGVLGLMKQYSKKAWYYLQDHPTMVGGSFFLGLIPIFLFCCLPFGDKKKGAKAAGGPAAAADDAADDDDDEGEEEEEEEEEEEPIEEVEEEPEPEPEPEPKKGSPKKRTPKAS